MRRSVISPTRVCRVSTSCLAIRMRESAHFMLMRSSFGQDHLQLVEAVVEAGPLVLVLGEEGLKPGVQLDGAVDLRVGAGPVGADADQLLHVGVGGEALAGLL